MKKIKVSSDKDAWRLLEALQTQDIQLDDVEFSGWPMYNLCVKGDRYHSSITPSLMAPLIELQKGLYKTASRAIYDDDNSSRLTTAQRLEFEYSLSVHEGSSDAKSDWADIFKKIIDTCAGKMSGKQVLTLLVCAGLLYTGNNVATRSFDHLDKTASASHEATVKKDANDAELKRMQLLADVIKQNPSIKKTQEEAEAVAFEILREASDAEKIVMNGVTITGEQAKAITDVGRSKSATVTLLENFRILALDTTSPIKTKVRVRKGQSEFVANFEDDSLDRRSIQLLQKHLLSRENVQLRIEAKKLSGKYIQAKITAVAPKRGTIAASGIKKKSG